MAANRLYTRWWARSFQRFATTRLGTWMLLNVATYTDPLILRWTNGRLSSGPLGGVPVGVLTTTGAKTGQPRSVPLMALRDGANIILIASRGGSSQNPGWYHNLKANPQADLYLLGQTRTYTAREALGAERERLWQRVADVHVGYSDYATRTGQRQIPIMVLEPID